MKHLVQRTDIPVLMLHNIDPLWNSEEKTAVFNAVDRLSAELQNEGHPVVNVPVTNDALQCILQPYNPKEYIVFNWCEELPSKPRSDHLVTEILEKLNFTFTGSSSKVLAFSWDKPATKVLLKKHDIPTPSWEVIETAESCSWDRFPAIVKPAYEHCSIGITSDAVVTDQQTLKNRVSFVRENFDQPSIVEDFIAGREFHVNIFGNKVVKVLPTAEMDFSAFENIKDRLCTFDSKFTPGSLHYEKILLRVPANLKKKQLLLLNEVAIKAYRALGCRDYARIDLRFDNELCHVLDVNPNPDFSPDTSTIYAAKEKGYSYGAIASWVITLAAQRHPVFSRKKNWKYYKPL